MDSKVKKPFYKRVWFWVIAVIVLLAIGGAMGGNKNSKTSATTSSSSSTSKASSSSSVASQKWSQADYDALTAGDIVNNGAGGENMDTVTSKFGKASTVTESTISNTTVKTAIWTNTNGDMGSGSNVTLQFAKQDDGTWLLTSKASTGLK
ncbi:hypothetical protein WOSG25_021880 [Weissella oryzae SG25]|uniref:Uncharacterized protein n=1 Tax=Weissella oryzae (strain DSM 25784 / JCM 18191 / LMG 30913 / SG25) TaxID=1329250 RepID=A0A069CZ99_WEIOS|nr:hypothetical protein [Weissella oryzae]GAK30391.1 hypothetical protein WOSG25_021880 [Weissella oryzae SG25]